MGALLHCTASAYAAPVPRVRVPCAGVPRKRCIGPLSRQSDDGAGNRIASVCAHWYNWRPRYSTSCRQTDAATMQPTSRRAVVCGVVLVVALLCGTDAELGLRKCSQLTCLVTNGHAYTCVVVPRCLRESRTPDAGCM